MICVRQLCRNGVIRTTLFFSNGLGNDGRTVVYPRETVLAAAITKARRLRARGAKVYIDATWPTARRLA